jgi:hypothetical protein
MVWRKAAGGEAVRIGGGGGGGGGGGDENDERWRK